MDTKTFSTLHRLWGYLRKLYSEDFVSSVCRDGYLELKSVGEGDDSAYFTREQALSFFDESYHDYVNACIDESLDGVDEDGRTCFIPYFSTNIVSLGKKVSIPYNYLENYLPDPLDTCNVYPPIDVIHISDVLYYDLDLLSKLELCSMFSDYDTYGGLSSFYIDSFGMSEEERKFLHSTFPVLKGGKLWSKVVELPDVESKTEFLGKFKERAIAYWIHMEGDDCVVSCTDDVFGEYIELFKYGSGVAADYGLASLLEYLQGIIKYPIKEIYVVGGTKVRLKKHKDGEVTVVIY